MFNSCLTVCAQRLCWRYRQLRHNLQHVLCFKNKSRKKSLRTCLNTLVFYSHVTCVTDSVSVLSVCKFWARARIPGRHAAAGLHRPQTGMCVSAQTRPLTGVCLRRRDLSQVCVCADDTSHRYVCLRRRDLSSLGPIHISRLFSTYIRNFNCRGANTGWCVRCSHFCRRARAALRWKSSTFQPASLVIGREKELCLTFSARY